MRVVLLVKYFLMRVFLGRTRDRARENTRSPNRSRRSRGGRGRAIVASEAASSEREAGRHRRPSAASLLAGGHDNVAERGEALATVLVPSVRAERGARGEGARSAPLRLAETRFHGS